MLKSVVIIFVLSTLTAAFGAELKPEEKITYRQSGYTFMRWNMAKIKTQVIDSPQSFNREQVIGAAQLIAATANSGIDTLFSTDTQTGKGWKETRVKPEFFKEGEQVKKYFADLRREANELAKVASDGDVGTLKSQFEKVQKVCKSCHDDFRTKD
ncbi:MAG: cytochrome c [Gammaproteobacteria bacterium]|nr:cytochrome c [Gammaproteobacteria bacterium]